MTKTIAFEQLLARLDVYALGYEFRGNVVTFLQNPEAINAAWDFVIKQWRSGSVAPERGILAIRARRASIIRDVRLHFRDMTREEKLLIRPYLRIMFKSWAKIEYALTMREIEDLL